MGASLATAIASLKELVNQRFEDLDLRYQKQLAEMDRRHEKRSDEADLRYQQRFDAQTTALGDAASAAEKAISAALDATEKAMIKAETANEKRFDSVNEFRAQLRDQASTFIPRIEAEQRLSQLGARVEELRTNDDRRTGRSSGSSALYGWIIGGIGALATIIVIATTLLNK